MSEPKVFIAGIVAILAEYPPQLHAVACIPTGIPRRLKTLRNLADIEEVCRDLYEPIARRITREKLADQPRLLPKLRSPEEQEQANAQVAAWFGKRA